MELLEKLSELKKQRDMLIGQINEIETAYDGSDNVNNNEKVFQLNIENSHLAQELKELKLRLSAIGDKKDMLEDKLDKLTTPGIEAIVEAIKEQRWFFIANNPKIIVDAHTGMLWANLNVFNWSTELRLDGINRALAAYKDEDSEIVFKCPRPRELWEAVEDKKFPFVAGDNWRILGRCRWYVVADDNTYTTKDLDANEAYEGISNRFNGSLLPCSSSLIDGTTYVNKLSATVYNQDERAKFFIEFLVENDLQPIFTDNEITTLFQKYYFEKPKLLEKLQPLQQEIANMEANSIACEVFDYKELLERYDIPVIEASAIRYHEAVVSWCNTLLGHWSVYKKELNLVINDVFSLTKLLRSSMKEQEAAFDAMEQKALWARSESIYKRLFLGNITIEGQLMNCRAASENWQARLQLVNENENVLQQLSILEKEERASFTFVAENTANIIKNAENKIRYYQENTSLIKMLSEAIVQWNQEYKENKEKLKASLNGCSKIEGEKLFSEWQCNSLAAEGTLSRLVELGLSNSEAEQVVKSSIIVHLANYKAALNDFYQERRLNADSLDSLAAVFNLQARLRNSIMEEMFKSRKAKNYNYEGEKELIGIIDELGMDSVGALIAKAELPKTMAAEDKLLYQEILEAIAQMGTGTFNSLKEFQKYNDQQSKFVNERIIQIKGRNKK